MDNLEEALKNEDVRELSSMYIELDEEAKKLKTKMDKIKKFLSKKEFKEEFPEKKKLLQNTEGKALSYISMEHLLKDFAPNQIVNFASVSEKDLRNYFIERDPSLSSKENESKLNVRVDEYKVYKGKGNPSIKIYKM